MLVKMKATVIGSPDGIIVNTYENGKEYDLPTRLAEIFLQQDVCIPVEFKEIKEIKPNENKEIKPQENKEQRNKTTRKQSD